MLRVVIHVTTEQGNGRDLEVPAEIPVHELAQLVGRALFASTDAPADASAARWTLQLEGGKPLHPDQSLADQSVFDGSYLALVDEDPIRSAGKDSSWWLESAIGSRFPLETDNVVLGRYDPKRPVPPGATLVELSQEPYGDRVSRIHARLERTSVGWSLTPVPNTTNRTQVNGQDVPRGESVAVGDNDVISLSRVRLTLRKQPISSRAIHASAQAFDQEDAGETQPETYDESEPPEPVQDEDSNDLTKPWLREPLVVLLAAGSLFAAGWALRARIAIRPTVAQAISATPYSSPMVTPPASPEPSATATTALSPAGGVTISAPAPASPEPTCTAAATQSPTTPIPPEARIEGVPMGKQSRQLSCELQSASDLSWYYGLPYTWEEIFLHVGHDPGGNPHVGFVGRSLNDAPGQLYPYGYGVYAEPIASALRELGLDARVHYGESRLWIQERIAEGNPVMIWAVGGMRVAPVEEWTASDGTVVRAVRLEHTYLVVGYERDGIWVHDPWDAQERFFPWEQFEASWDLLGRMAVVVYGRLEDAPAAASLASQTQTAHS
jgi:uncharacterized protein YvpB